MAKYEETALIITDKAKAEVNAALEALLTSIGGRADMEADRATRNDLQIARDIGELKEVAKNTEKTLERMQETLDRVVSQQVETALLKQWKEEFYPDHLRLMAWMEVQHEQDERRQGSEALSTRMWRALALVMTTVVALHDPILHWLHRLLQGTAKHG